MNFCGQLHSGRMIVCAVFVAVLLNWSSRRVDAAPLGWKPARTWVFAASMVQFKEKEMFEAFDAENRRDDRLIQFFRGRGVPSNHIVYLKDKQATLRAIQTAFAAMLKKTSPGDTVFFYYQGHGYRGENKANKDAFFAAYDTDGDSVDGLSVNSITATINRYFKGNRAILTADCCYSGYLAQTVKKNRGRVNYASITSSSAREVSTGNWTFTDCLLDALRGAAYVDQNGDGAISVGELASHAHDEMAIAEEQHSAFALSGNFARDTVLANSGPKLRAPIGQRVKAKQDGTWYAARVVGVRGKRLEVSYIGYDEPTEWFDAKDTTQLRRIKIKPTFPVGAKVEVEWKGDWYEARVLKVDGGVHFIHYIEDDSSWDEWVSSKRIRAPR